MRQIAFENGSFENVRDLVLDGKLDRILIKLDLPSLFKCIFEENAFANTITMCLNRMNRELLRNRSSFTHLPLLLS